MTDLTATLSTILVDKHSSKPISKKSAQLNVQLDSFLKEAYQINRSITSLLQYLRAIRQPYLSTAPPPRRIHSNTTSNLNTKQVAGFGEIPSYLTDAQREDIDSRTAVLLRDFDRSISNLRSAAELQADTAGKVLERKYGKRNGFLWRWAGGDADDGGDSGKSEIQLKEEGMVKNLGSFREGVIWFLNQGLKDTVAVQGEMVEVRLEREQEKRMSVLYDERNKGVNNARKVMDDDEVESTGDRDVRGKDTYNPALESAGQLGLSELSAEQLQLFEEENSSLLNHYTDTLKKVTQAEKSLMEISSLQQTLVGHLTVQGEMIGQLVEDAGRTDENVRRGNKELKKASERGSLARGVFWGTCGLCSFLIVWDLIF